MTATIESQFSECHINGTAARPTVHRDILSSPRVCTEWSNIDFSTLLYASWFHIYIWTIIDMICEEINIIFHQYIPTCTF